MALISGFNVLFSDFPEKRTWRGRFLLHVLLLSRILVICFCLLKLVSTFNSCSLCRKIEIVQFASRTRQLFVRLLALVKWASNAGKVEKCAVRVYKDYNHPIEVDFNNTQHMTLL